MRNQWYKMAEIFRIDRELMMKGLEETMKHQLNLIDSLVKLKVGRMERATSLDDELKIALSKDEEHTASRRYAELESVFTNLGGDYSIYSLKYQEITQPLSKRNQRLAQAVSNRQAVLNEQGEGITC